MLSNACPVISKYILVNHATTPIKDHFKEHISVVKNCMYKDINRTSLITYNNKNHTSPILGQLKLLKYTKDNKIQHIWESICILYSNNKYCKPSVIRPI